MIDITGLSKASVLAALYNNATPRGMGWMTAIMDGRQPFDPMTEEEAEKYIANGGPLDIDYLQGRPLKVDLRNDDGFEEWLYDRDNGKGAAQEAIDSIRRSQKQ